ncbi:MAG: AAA family ATPase [Chloroflexi bacterium]|nr:AAA family ATPase [Chloroflexota bacterium]
MSLEITDDMDALIQIFPPEIEQVLRGLERFPELIEVVMDLGRPPTARFGDQEVVLQKTEVTQEQLDYITRRIGSFGDDNRAGIERTLHRISAIRNRHAKVIGLTCRVGRAVFGTIDIIQDLVDSGQSILLLGRPGIGKTTMLREAARILADKHRVVIVDTSNEIGGDGDIPHSAIGKARRMQVATPALQHAVMIEAVENHMPEVIVIDEIGTELEAEAARTIAERGVQLVGTAHGNTLENLMLNPTLSDLIGGIQTVTLSDEEARRRGTQKSVLERKAPPTFGIVVEIQNRHRVAVRKDVAAEVDALLRGRVLVPEIRERQPDGQIETIKAPQAPDPLTVEVQLGNGLPAVHQPVRPRNGRSSLRIYPFGLNQSRLRQAAKRLGVNITLADSLSDADALFTLRTYYRRHPPAIAEAEQCSIPIYVLRNNTTQQMEAYLADMLGVTADENTIDPALDEARNAIARISAGDEDAVQLSPQEARVRRLQHNLVREANLLSRSSGNEPRRQVTIYSSHRGMN